MSPSRILFPFEGGLAGGSHMSALMLVEALDRARHDPLILLHRAEGTLLDELRRRGLPWVAAPVAIAPLGKAALLLRAPARARWLAENRIDIVHSNEGLMHVAWGTAARLAGVPQLWHHRASPDARALRLVAPWTARELASVSHFSLPEGHRLARLGRAHVVRSPFALGPALEEARRAAPGLRRQLDIADDCTVIGFFGHYAARKRPILFLEALAEARRRTDRPLFGLMFGLPYDPGSAEGVSAAIQRLGLSGIVRQMGFQRPVEGWMAACDINLVTAVEEPFGRTLVESMLLGTALVAADSGGNPEAIRQDETGLLVPPDDASAFADAIVRMADPALRARLSAAARADAQARFGIETHVRQVAQIYDRLSAAGLPAVPARRDQPPPGPEPASDPARP